MLGVSSIYYVALQQTNMLLSYYLVHRATMVKPRRSGAVPEGYVDSEAWRNSMNDILKRFKELEGSYFQIL